MKILQVHNYYQQRGGEDQVVAAEAALLRSKGIDVIQHTVHNDSISGLPGPRLALQTIWNASSYREIWAIIRRERPQVAHFHNIFPLISPAAYAACNDEQVPVIQTLHNYRLMCVNAYLFRDGAVCEDCVEWRVACPGVIHGCYRGSRAASLVTAGMLAFHRAAKTWERRVDQYVALTVFSRDKLVQGGLSQQKITVKPNFVPDDPGTGKGDGNFALYVGRFSPEKGIEALLRAWKQIGERLPLKIIGDGPLSGLVKEFCEHHDNIEWLGRLEHGVTLEVMRAATLLVFPSACYETMGNSIIEAYACGLPVIASNLGSAAALVRDGETGMLFKAGSGRATGNIRCSCC